MADTTVLTVKIPSEIKARLYQFGNLDDVVTKALVQFILDNELNVLTESL